MHKIFIMVRNMILDYVSHVMKHFVTSENDNFEPSITIQLPKLSSLQKSTRINKVLVFYAETT